MLVNSNLSFKVKEFSSRKDVDNYKSLLKLRWKNKIYYSYEYLIYYENEHHKLKYFLLEEDGIPIILMPFYIRDITSNLEDNYNYFDVITPYGYGGPLFDLKYTDVLAFFWKKADEWYKNNNVISEFVRFSLTENYVGYTGELVHTLTNIKGTIFSDQDKQWKNFVPKVRNNYRMALKSDLTFSSICGEKIIEKDIIDFHKIYIETMERNNADERYFFKLDYFKNLIFQNIDNFSIIFVSKEGVRISTELLICWSDTIYAFLGGTKEEFFKYRPNDFLRVEVIKWASEKNIAFYVLGGGMVDNDGLFKNKKALFPKDNNPIFYTGRKILNQKVYNELTKKHANSLEIDESSFFPKYRQFS